MLAKIIVGVAGLLVLGAGSYVYWQDINGSSPCRRCSRSCDGIPIINQPQSSYYDISISCPAYEGDARSSETLETMPREVPEE
jgi:hypothetical protein